MIRLRPGGVAFWLGRRMIAAGRIFEATAPSGYRRAGDWSPRLDSLNVGRYGVLVCRFAHAPEPRP